MVTNSYLTSVSNSLIIRHVAMMSGDDLISPAQCVTIHTTGGAVAELVGIEGGVVSGVINLESSGVEASDWRPRHDEPYHEA